MRRALRDLLPHGVHCLRRLLACPWYTLRGYGAARWWAVQLAHGVRFHGPVRFERVPGSVIRIGPDCRFRPSTQRPCLLQAREPGACIEIGRDCGLSGTYIACTTRIRLGDHVKCGADTTIWDTDFHPEDPRSGADAPITLEDHVWLGAQVTVLKGVTIGAHTLVGNGSLVLRSLPPGVVAMGVPARAVRSLQAHERLQAAPGDGGRPVNVLEGVGP